MCGIAGIVTFDELISATELHRFTSSLSHRGPDAMASEIFRKVGDSSGEVGLGHTRLAILDLSDAGKCPMPYTAPSGTKYRITFNGEIFNFLELRAELSSSGYRFRTETDTEVIAAAYDKWGAACLYRFNGMWAFAIYNEVDSSLFLARDRFGVKPLYYRVSSRFEFASELKAFTQLENFTPILNPEIVPTLIQKFRYDGATDATALADVKSLLGGYCILLTASGEMSTEQWWNTAEHLQDVPRGYDFQVEQFRELFLDAVRIRMRSDVPVGTCLSGGVDSSAVACGMSAVQKRSSDLLSRCTSDWQRTFIATFSGTQLDERVHAEEIVKYIGAKPTYYDFSHEESLARLTDCIWSLDEPTGGYAISPWLLYRTLRKSNVVVSLDGHGGDELLGGYSWYLDEKHSTLNETLYNQFHQTILPSILRNYDRCSAAHGIEVRMPLLDFRVVTYAFSLAAEAKIGGGYTKRILRDAMNGLMPDSIRLRRQKVGFNAPMIEWFNGGLVPLIEKVSSSRFWKDNPYFDGKSIAPQILERSKAKGWTMADWNTTYQISTLMNLSIWHQLFVEKEGRSQSTSSTTRADLSQGDI